jgi:hypothetical protein
MFSKRSSMKYEEVLYTIRPILIKISVEFYSSCIKYLKISNPNLKGAFKWKRKNYQDIYLMKNPQYGN